MSFGKAHAIHAMEWQLQPRCNSRKSKRNFIRRVAITSFCVAMLVSVGCGQKASSLPETFPVTGTVRDASGTPLGGGSIEFLAKQNQELLAVSNIAEDGSFNLSTYLNGESEEGAVAGEHQVTVYTQQVEHGDSTSVRLQKPVTVEENDNEIEIELPRLDRRRSKR